VRCQSNTDSSIILTEIIAKHKDRQSRLGRNSDSSVCGHHVHHSCIGPLGPLPSTCVGQKTVSFSLQCFSKPVFLLPSSINTCPTNGPILVPLSCNLGKQTHSSHIGPSVCPGTHSSLARERLDQPTRDQTQGSPPALTVNVASTSARYTDIAPGKLREVEEFITLLSFQPNDR